MLYPSFAAWINSFLACMGWVNLIVWNLYNDPWQSRGCIGSFAKPSNILPGCSRSEGKHFNGIPVERSSVSDGFWIGNACDVDVGATLSQRSLSSLSTLNESLFSDLSSRGTTTIANSNASEFVNHGLLLWNQIRKEWTGGKKLQNESQKSRNRMINICSTYDSLLTSNKPFRQPIPLSEMVEFLVDVWEEEGLYE